jgi:hypothetical protein
MSQQQTLFKVPAQPQEPSEKQAIALTYLQNAGAEGLDGQRLGRLMHQHDGCRFCKSAGLDLLRALKKKGHARQTRGGIFVALDLPSQQPTTDQDIPY